MAIADRVADGEDPESARLAAIKEFGNAAGRRKTRARCGVAARWRSP